MLKTKDGKLLNIEILSASDVSDLLELLLPSFTRIFDDYDFRQLKFYKASYQFGNKIIHNKKGYLPLANGEDIEFNASTLPDELSKDLSYNYDNDEPLGVLINKSSELYLPTGNTIMSHAMLHPGDWIGIASSINSADSPITSSTQWNLNAGARYIFTLSKATSKAKHAKIQKLLKINLDCPMTSEKQWEIFVEIAKQAAASWRHEIIFFPREFINLLKTEKLIPLAKQLLEIRRLSYNVWHNTSLIWDACFNAVEQERRLWTYSSYALFISRQLFIIAANSANGFIPAINDDAAPISLLQDIYTNVYGITEDNHSNVIMQPTDFRATDTNPVYYSINYPTLARHNPDTFKGKTLITLLDDVERITRSYQEYVPQVTPNTQSLTKTARHNKFTFYHDGSDEKNYPNILNAKEIMEQDTRFTQNQSGRVIEHSQFFKGIIKIEHLNKV